GQWGSGGTWERRGGEGAWHLRTRRQVAAAASATETPRKARPILPARWPELNCRAVITQISNYLDGELTASARQDLEQHLHECKECELVVSQTKLTVDLYCDAEIVELPEDVKMRLHQALRGKLSQGLQS